MRGRMREASIPLIAGSVLGAISLALTLKRPGKLAKGGMVLSGVALLGALYVWVSYGAQIINAM